MAEVLTRRELNRATLARQLLLERAPRPPLETVRHLVGMQAQVPHNPYTGLWSRLEGFQPEQLSELLEQRQVVRTTVMRATIHLVTAEDCLTLRPLVQSVLDAEIARHRDYSPVLAGVPIEPVLEYGRKVLAAPRTGPELRSLLAERFPERDAAALAYACRCYLPLVQVPPRGLWGRSSQVTVATAEAWLGRPLVAKPSLDDVVLRYLGAFGPAAVADVTTWCRLTGMRAVLERLRPRLVTFEDERGRELFDLPDAPRPDPASPAPVRFLPEYDNVLLSHDDRSRIVANADRTILAQAGGLGCGAVLVDGFAKGVWRIGDDALVVRHLPLPTRAQAAVLAEGRRLLRFLGSDARDVRLALLT